MSFFISIYELVSLLPVDAGTLPENSYYPVLNCVYIYLLDFVERSFSLMFFMVDKEINDKFGRNKKNSGDKKKCDTCSRCSHCNKFGHAKDQCWIHYPLLRLQFDKYNVSTPDISI